MFTKMVKNFTFSGFLAVALPFFIEAVLAAEGETAEPIQSELAHAISRNLEERGRHLIERHIAAEDFQIFVTVTTDGVRQLPLPFFSESLSALIFENMSLEQVKSHIRQVNIEILLEKRFNRATQNKLETILVKKLLLDKSRGDKITFGELGIEDSHAKSELERSVSKAEDDVRSLQMRLETMSKERDDAKRELALAKADVDRLARDLQLANNPPGGANAQAIWKQHLGLLALAILLPLALLLTGLTLRAAASILATSIRSIGENLPVLGDKIAESALAGLEPSKELGRKEWDNSSVEDSAQAIDMESTHDRILVLNEELRAALNESTEAAILQHVCRLLDRPGQVARAVVSLELLGRDKANELYHKLGPDHQALVAEFLRSGKHEKPKYQLMLEAGEELKTRIFAKALGTSRGTIQDDVQTRIMQLKADDLAEIAKILDSETLPRFFLYLEPAKLGVLMARLHQQDPVRFVKFARTITQIPDSEVEIKRDAELIQALDEQIRKTQDQRQRPYFNFYRALIESVDEEVSELLVEQLVNADASVATFIRDNVVTFSTFALLQDELRLEIIEGLTNRDLAGLLWGLSDGVKRQMDLLVGERRKPLVQEEVERLQNKGQRQAALAHRRAKQVVVSRIMEIKGNGPLSEYLKKEEKEVAPVVTELKESA